MQVDTKDNSASVRHEVSRADKIVYKRIGRNAPVFAARTRRNGAPPPRRIPAEAIKYARDRRPCRSLSPRAIFAAIKSDISAGAVYRDSTKNLSNNRPVGRSKNQALRFPLLSIVFRGRSSSRSPFSLASTTLFLHLSPLPLLFSSLPPPKCTYRSFEFLRPISARRNRKQNRFSYVYYIYVLYIRIIIPPLQITRVSKRSSRRPRMPIRLKRRYSPIESMLGLLSCHVCTLHHPDRTGQRKRSATCNDSRLN